MLFLHIRKIFVQIFAINVKKIIIPTKGRKKLVVTEK